MAEGKETALRVDALHVAVMELNRNMMELLAETRSATSRDTLLASLMGAASGAITGAMVAAAIVNYMLPIIER
jgi:hypothetical protein